MIPGPTSSAVHLTINEANNGVFRTQDRVLDIGAFIRHVAVGMFIAENDRVLGIGDEQPGISTGCRTAAVHVHHMDKSEAFKGGASFAFSQHQQCRWRIRTG
jgi:hypothetical protein